MTTPAVRNRLELCLSDARACRALVEDEGPGQRERFGAPLPPGVGVPRPSGTAQDDPTHDAQEEVVVLVSPQVPGVHVEPQPERFHEELHQRLICVFVHLVAQHCPDALDHLFARHLGVLHQDDLVAAVTVTDPYLIGEALPWGYGQQLDLDAGSRCGPGGMAAGLRADILPELVDGGLRYSQLRCHPVDPGVQFLRQRIPHGVLHKADPDN